MADKPPRVISRRDLLTGATLTGIAATTGFPSVATAQGAAATQTSEAYEHLTTEEATLLEAIADELIPPDEHGPGAIEARAVHYIDRALGGALSGALDDYRSGLAALDRYCRQSRGVPFTELSPADRISVLVNVETGTATGFAESSSAFFSKVRRHVLEGTFGDPYYGGNHNFIGWDLLGYPGVRTAVTPDAQQRLEGNELRPSRRSAYDWETFTKASARLSRRDPQHGN